MFKNKFMLIGITTLLTVACSAKSIDVAKARELAALFDRDAALATVDSFKIEASLEMKSSETAGTWVIDGVTTTIAASKTTTTKMSVSLEFYRAEYYLLQEQTTLQTTTTGSTTTNFSYTQIYKTYKENSKYYLANYMEMKQTGHDTETASQKNETTASTLNSAYASLGTDEIIFPTDEGGSSLISAPSITSILDSVEEGEFAAGYENPTVTTKITSPSGGIKIDIKLTDEGENSETTARLIYEINKLGLLKKYSTTVHEEYPYGTDDYEVEISVTYNKVTPVIGWDY